MFQILCFLDLAFSVWYDPKAGVQTIKSLHSSLHSQPPPISTEHYGNQTGGLWSKWHCLWSSCWLSGGWWQWQQLPETCNKQKLPNILKKLSKMRLKSQNENKQQKNGIHRATPLRVIQEYLVFIKRRSGCKVYRIKEQNSELKQQIERLSLPSA